MRMIIAVVVMKVAMCLAKIAIRIAGSGFVDAEILGNPEAIDFDAFAGAFLLFVFILFFWFITP